MTDTEGQQPLPGHQARYPAEIPSRGWWQILRRVYSAVVDGNLPLIAAGLAFFALLGIFPGLTALVTLYGLLADPYDIQGLVGQLRGILPEEARALLYDQLQALLETPSSGLGLGLLFSLLLLLWSTSTGTQYLIRAVNSVYGETETRSFIRLRGLAIGFTVGSLVFLVLSVALGAVLPEVVERIGLTIWGDLVVRALGWLVLAMIGLVGLAMIYRFAPDRRAARWRWVSIGSLTALALWLSASGAFSYYVREFGTYSETYGALGAIVVLLFWFYLSAFVVLLGAVVNAETEHQTARDSTVGPNRPPGHRNAWVADHRPPPPGSEEEGRDLQHDIGDLNEDLNTSVPKGRDEEME